MPFGIDILEDEISHEDMRFLKFCSLTTPQARISSGQRMTIRYVVKDMAFMTI